MFDTCSDGEESHANSSRVCLKGILKGSKEESDKGMIIILCELGIPAQAVEVDIHDLPKEDWGVAGECASERFKGAPMP
jgi:hypothetical protein